NGPRTAAPRGTGSSPQQSFRLPSPSGHGARGQPGWRAEPATLDAVAKLQISKSKTCIRRVRQPPSSTTASGSEYCELPSRCYADWMLSSGRRLPYRVLCSFSNGPSFGNLPARRSTAGAGLGTFPHSLDMFVLSALCSTGFTDVRTDIAEL